MKGISKTEYVALRKKGSSYMSLPVHEDNLQKQVDETLESLNNFLNNSPDEIHKMQIIET